MNEINRTRVDAGRDEVWLGDVFLGYVSNWRAPGNRVPGKGLVEWGYHTTPTEKLPYGIHCMAGCKTRADAVAGLVDQGRRAGLLTTAGMAALSEDTP